MWLAHLANEVLQLDCAEAAVLWGLSECLEVLHGGHGERLSRTLANKFCEGGRVALLAWSHLATDASRKAVAKWQIKPKHHQFDHILRTTRCKGKHFSQHWAFC